MMSSNGDSHSHHVHSRGGNTPREIVTVFWDYENCPCPMSTKIATLTYDIKRRIDFFIGRKLNKRIQLYCPMERLHQKTRENATDLGILLMDVATKRKQESVDKRIIADIGLFAAELAESKDIGHIVLVSGDSDFGYILARLRDKSYVGKIIMFINDYTKETLTQHADFTHCLFQSNLTRKDNPFSDYNQRKIPTAHKFSPYQYSPSTYTQHSASYHNLPYMSPYQMGSASAANTNSHPQWNTYNFPYSAERDLDRDRSRDRMHNGSKRRGGAASDANGVRDASYTSPHHLAAHQIHPSSYSDLKDGHFDLNGGKKNTASQMDTRANSKNREKDMNKSAKSHNNHNHNNNSNNNNNGTANHNSNSNNNNNGTANHNSNSNANSAASNASKSGANSGSSYVYRRKEKESKSRKANKDKQANRKHQHHDDDGSNNEEEEEEAKMMNGHSEESKMKIATFTSKNGDILSAPTPIPPKAPSSMTPSPLKSASSSESNGSAHSKSKQQRIVSHENLEQQLKAQQREQQRERQRERERERQRQKQSQASKLLNGGSPEPSSPHDINDRHNDSNSAVIDGTQCKPPSTTTTHLSTFAVGSLSKINECDDDESSKQEVDKSPLLQPNRLDFNKEDTVQLEPRQLSSDFFATMIAPKDDDMNELMQDILPPDNIFHGNGKTLNLAPKTSHIINLQKVKSSASAPKGLLIKKRTNGQSQKQKQTESSLSHQDADKGKEKEKEKDEAAVNKEEFANILRLVWDALTLCQQQGNNTPRREELYRAMYKVHGKYMHDKDDAFCKRAVDECLHLGCIEEIIKGRISPLYVLPVILNALTSDESMFYQRYMEKQSRHQKKNVNEWITLDALRVYLKQRYADHLATYFTLTYLYRIISNATRLFTFHKDDKHKNGDELEDHQLKALRFKVRKHGYQQAAHQRKKQLEQQQQTTSYPHTKNAKDNGYYS